MDMDEVWARADAEGACRAALGDFLDPDLPWRKVGEVSRGRVFNRNLEHLKNVAAKLHSSDASKHIIVADMGASAQRRQASVDECPCITSARGMGKWLWVALVRSGKACSMRPLSLRELFRLQGWSGDEFDVLYGRSRSGRHASTRDCANGQQRSDQPRPSDTAMGHRDGARLREFNVPGSGQGYCSLAGSSFDEALDVA